MTGDVRARLERMARGEEDKSSPSVQGGRVFAITPKPTEPTAPKPTAKRQFVVYTEDFSGLGWYKLLQDAGEDVVMVPIMAEDEKNPKEFKKVGEGWVKKVEPEKAPTGKNVYHIFDSNKLADLADKLRAKREKVFGTSKLSAKMEHDRDFTTNVAKEAGLDLPETKEFSKVEEGIKFLESHPDKAYVFKPDAAEFNYLTYVPFREKDEDANEDLRFYLEDVPFDGTYILQQRVKGVEVNVEAWLDEHSEPFFAFATLENKRKEEHDQGEMAGCAGDIVFTIPLDGELFKMTIAKMLPFYKKEHVSGFVDVNVIIGDNEVWFLEVCNRFGYNSHPNLFLSLALDTFGSIIADFMDGKTKGMEKRFRKGYGSSVSVYIEHLQPGVLLHVSPDTEKQYYPFDGYLKKDKMRLAGYSNEVGIFVDFDYTIQGSAESAYHKLFFNEAVSFPNMFMRLDLGKRDYPGSPDRRHEALRRMGLIT